jgi:hypothetical protein
MSCTGFTTYGVYQKFWLVLFSLLALHFLGFGLVLHAIEHFPLIWSAVLVPLEPQAAIVVYRHLGIHPTA